MKTLTSILVFVLAFGFTTLSFAGNHPALTYPSGQFSATGGKVEVGPWHKGALAYQGGVVVPGPWYSNCPVTRQVINSKHPGAEVALSNGKRALVCCVPCKKDIEKDLGKYQAYLF